MIVFWRIRYLDRTEHETKDRDLYVDTDSLDAKTKAAVELCYELNSSGASRDMLKYRHLFREDNVPAEEKLALCSDKSLGCVYFLREYFEDESGREITVQEMGSILTGNPLVLAIPHWARQHDIDYMLAPPAPIKVAALNLAEEQLKVLGYFARDLRELESATFVKEGPGTITCSQGVDPTLQTAVSDEGIRSFVTIFRRLYMSGEPANFLTVVKQFIEIAGDKPLVKWVEGVAGQYEAELGKKPDFLPFDGRENWAFTRKRLIDVFLYTRYAHQPDEKRSRQFQKCLDSVGNKGQLLTWLFFSEIWHASIHMINAGRVIARVYDAYCQLAGRWPSLLDSVHNETPGIGQLETKATKRERILQAKVEALAESLWQEQGRPVGGPAAFVEQARANLQATLSE